MRPTASGNHDLAMAHSVAVACASDRCRTLSVEQPGQAFTEAGTGMLHDEGRWTVDGKGRENLQKSVANIKANRGKEN